MGSSVNVAVNVTVDRQALAVLRDLQRELRGFRQAVVDLRRDAGGTDAVLAGLARSVTAFLAAFAGLQAIKAFITEGFKFNAVVETSRLGIASLITSMGELRDAQGNLLGGTEALRAAQELSADQVQKLRIAGLQTVATTEELTTAFQQAVGVGLKYGLTLDQIRQTTIGITQAAGALGVPMNQLNEEIRSLLAGTISIRNTRVASALGITNADIRRVQETGKLFEFIQGKLEAFNVAGAETAKTFSGVTSNLKEAFQVFAGDATKPLFDAFKISGQQALEGMFDLDKATVSDKFRGILEIFQQVFAGAGEILTTVINGAVSGAADLSKFLLDNKDTTDEILLSLREISQEFVGLIDEVGGVLLELTAVGVKAGFIQSIFRVIAFVIAGLRDGLKLVVGVLGAIGGGILTLILTPFRGWLLLIGKTIGLFNKELGQTLVDNAEAIDEMLKESAAGVRGIFSDFAEGDTATQRLIDRLGKFQEETKKTTSDVKKLGATLTSKPFKPETTGAKNDPKQFAQAATTIVLAELKKQETALQLSLDRNEISYRDYYAKLDALQIGALEKQIEIQNQLLNVTTDAGDQAVIRAQIQKLEDERSTIATVNAQKRAEAEKKVTEQVLAAQSALFENQGRLVDARIGEITKKYTDLIARLKAEGDTKGLAVVEALFNTEVAQARVDELEKQASRVTETLEGRVSETSALAEAHMITERQARERLTAAYAEASVELRAIIPLYEAAALATGNPEQIARVTQLKNKLLEVNIAFKQQADFLFRLKETALDATTSALANVFTDIAALGGQSRREIEALEGQLSSAEKELNKLLKLPPTSETGERITQLRGEIKGITVDLANSKDELRTWVNVFEDAARSIVKALQDVVSQMIATFIIQSALSFVGGFSGGGSVSGTRVDNPLINVASGGFIAGPGTGTSDSIPARLSNGEYVVRAASVRRFGVDFLDAINGSSGYSVRRGRRGYAMGGLVSAPAGTENSLDATIGLEDGLVISKLKTTEGARAVMTIIGENRKALKQLLGA